MTNGRRRGRVGVTVEGVICAWPQRRFRADMTPADRRYVYATSQDNEIVAWDVTVHNYDVALHVMESRS